MNEYPNEINFYLQNKHMRPLEYLQELGVLDGRFISAHSLLLSEKGKRYSCCKGCESLSLPIQQLRGKAVPDTPALLSRGICTGLGK